MGELTVDYAALDAARGERRRCSRELTSARESLSQPGLRALDGAGQFTGSLHDGVATFVLSWRAALHVFATSADAIATLTADAVAVYTAADTQLGADVPLTGAQ